MNASFLTPTQTNILMSLATYKFLTISQMQRLTIATKSHLYRSIVDLRQENRDYVRRGHYPKNPAIGRIDDVYYLSRRGVNLLVKSGTMLKDEIKHFSFRGKLFSWQYYHRLHTIDMQVCVNVSTHIGDYTVVNYDRYFDTVGSPKAGGRTSLAKIPITSTSFIIPDSVALLKKGNTTFLFLIEIYMGDKTTRVLQQLEKHRRAITLGSPSLAYNHPRGNRVLSLFENSTCMEAVMKGMRSQPVYRTYTNNYLFMTIDQMMQEGSIEGWIMLDGKRTSLFE